jgi:hypothetical protein
MLRCPRGAQQELRLTGGQSIVGSNPKCGLIGELEETAMTLAKRRRYPGRPDINDQFTPHNIKKTLADYKEVKDRGGDYTFGALTAKFNYFNAEQTEDWESVLAGEYPKDVQDEIKRHIIHALTHRDDHGHESPIPLTMKWSSGPRAVVVTYNPSGPSYKIEIFGFISPAASRLAERPAKKKK